jgi:hypothetical protein
MICFNQTEESRQNNVLIIVYCLDPYAWLKDTLEKLPVWPYSRIDELLPFKHELP